MPDVKLTDRLVYGTRARYRDKDGVERTGRFEAGPQISVNHDKPVWMFLQDPVVRHEVPEEDILELLGTFKE